MDIGKLTLIRPFQSISTFRIFQTNKPSIDSKILKIFWFKIFAFKVYQNLTLFYAFYEVWTLLVYLKRIFPPSCLSNRLRFVIVASVFSLPLLVAEQCNPAYLWNAISCLSHISSRTGWYQVAFHSVQRQRNKGEF